MADIDAYKDKFSDSGRRVLETALDESKRRDQNYVAIEHKPLQQMLKLMEALDEADDTRNVWTNADFEEKDIEASVA